MLLFQYFLNETTKWTHRIASLLCHEVLNQLRAPGAALRWYNTCLAIAVEPCGECTCLIPLWPRQIRTEVKIILWFKILQLVARKFFMIWKGACWEESRCMQIGLKETLSSSKDGILIFNFCFFFCINSVQSSGKNKCFLEMKRSWETERKKSVQAAGRRRRCPSEAVPPMQVEEISAVDCKWRTALSARKRPCSHAKGRTASSPLRCEVRGGGERSPRDPRGREPAAGLALALGSGQTEAKGKAKAEGGAYGAGRGLSRPSRAVSAAGLLPLRSPRRGSVPHRLRPSEEKIAAF